MCFPFVLVRSVIRRPSFAFATFSTGVIFSSSSSYYYYYYYTRNGRLAPVALLFAYALVLIVANINIIAARSLLYGACKLIILRRRRRHRRSADCNNTFAITISIAIQLLFFRCRKRFQEIYTYIYILYRWFSTVIRVTAYYNIAPRGLARDAFDYLGNVPKI